MKTEHTKGPWEADSATHRGCTYIEQPNEGENGGWVVATCWGADREANARLIAAAPELLEALYAALPCVEESEEFDKPHGPKLSVTIRALLAQVEGNV